MFSRFDTKHACYRQTDRQTDGIAVAFIRATCSILSILPRVKRKEKENLKSRMQKKSSLKLYIIRIIKRTLKNDFMT